MEYCDAGDLGDRVNEAKARGRYCCCTVLRCIVLLSLGGNGVPQNRRNTYAQQTLYVQYCAPLRSLLARLQLLFFVLGFQLYPCYHQTHPRLDSPMEQ